MLISAVVVGFIMQGASVRLPFLSPIFSDHMVLQRGRANTFWGWTTPGRTVRVSIAGKSGEGVADEDGKWTVKVNPPKVGGPYIVDIEGPEKRTLFDVLVGDVWVCGGQSNMQFGVMGTTNGKAEVAAAKHPRIRFSIVPTRMAFDSREFTNAPWKVCSPETIGNDEWNGLSAVGYYFARELQKNLDIPIGLVHDNRGGSAAESWVSRPTLEKMGDFNDSLAKIDEAVNTRHANYGKEVEAWIDASDPGSKGLASAQPGLDDSKWEPVSLPASYTDLGFGWHTGVTWFRTVVNLPSKVPDGDAILSLGVLSDQDWTYVNGKRVGSTFAPRESRTYIISASDLKPGRNVIAVRILSNGPSDGFASGPKRMRLTLGDGWNISLAGSDWRANRGPNLWSGKGNFPWGLEGGYGTPSVHYNAMITPIAPLTVRGAIWYQGESNVGRSRQYINLIQRVASDWRAAFQSNDFPFLQVQLASYLKRTDQPGESSWAALREAQMLASREIPGGGLVTAIDVGEADDIHPRNKQEVGLRLARQALNQVYGKRNIRGAGPLYRGFSQEGPTLKVHFTGIRKGLVLKDVEPSGFAVAGPDRKFYWATVKIEGDHLVLSSPMVATPITARYAWADNPEMTLFDGTGLPAFPFRTDDWPVY